MKNEKISKTKYPGVTYVKVFPENPSDYDLFVSDRPYKNRPERYIWFSSDPAFNATFGGGYKGRIGIHEGYWRTVRPGEVCSEGWDFSLRIYNALKKIDGLDFKVHPPSEGYIILHIRPVWLNAAIQKLCRLELGPHQGYHLQIPLAWRKKKGVVKKISEMVSSIWSAYQTHAMRWETLADIAVNINHPEIGDGLAKCEKHEIPEHPEVNVFRYLDGSVRVTGAPAWDSSLDYVAPSSQHGLEQIIADVKSYLDDKDDNHYG